MVSKKHIIFKVIAVTLIIAMLWQGVSFASDEMRSCLAVPNKFTPICSIEYVNGHPKVDLESSDLEFLRTSPPIFMLYMIASVLTEDNPGDIDTENLIYETIVKPYGEEVLEGFDWRKLTYNKDDDTFTLFISGEGKNWIFSKEEPTQEHILRLEYAKDKYVSVRVKNIIESLPTERSPGSVEAGDAEGTLPEEINAVKKLADSVLKERNEDHFGFMANEEGSQDVAKIPYHMLGVGIIIAVIVTMASYYFGLFILNISSLNFHNLIILIKMTGGTAISFIVPMFAFVWFYNNVLLSRYISEKTNRFKRILFSPTSFAVMAVFSIEGLANLFVNKIMDPISSVDAIQLGDTAHALFESEILTITNYRNMLPPEGFLYPKLFWAIADFSIIMGVVYYIKYCRVKALNVYRFAAGLIIAAMICNRQLVFFENYVTDWLFTGMHKAYNLADIASTVGWSILTWGFIGGYIKRAIRKFKDETEDIDEDDPEDPLPEDGSVLPPNAASRFLKSGSLGDTPMGESKTLTNEVEPDEPPVNPIDTFLAKVSDNRAATLSKLVPLLQGYAQNTPKSIAIYADDLFSKAYMFDVKDGLAKLGKLLNGGSIVLIVKNESLYSEVESNLAPFIQEHSKTKVELVKQFKYRQASEKQQTSIKEAEDLIRRLKARGINEDQILAIVKGGKESCIGEFRRNTKLQQLGIHFILLNYGGTDHGEKAAFSMLDIVNEIASSQSGWVSMIHPIESIDRDMYKEILEREQVYTKA
ncbi:MAG: hypothetical protein HQ579_02160 [Candidatus Omnitrophica bacterium]|nr:hypothetical protein [Candidatus Omnitrophota bacterium]